MSFIEFIFSLILIYPTCVGMLFITVMWFGPQPSNEVRTSVDEGWLVKDGVAYLTQDQFYKAMGRYEIQWFPKEAKYAGQWQDIKISRANV